MVVLLTNVVFVTVTPVYVEIDKVAPSSKPVPLTVTVCDEGLVTGTPSSLGVTDVMDTNVGEPLKVYELVATPSAGAGHGAVMLIP
jgi:hypothetical protein